jgi:hypothetical protein
VEPNEASTLQLLLVVKVDVDRPMGAGQELDVAEWTLVRLRLVHQPVIVELSFGWKNQGTEGARVLCFVRVLGPMMLLILMQNNNRIGVNRKQETPCFDYLGNFGRVIVR